MNHNEMQLNHFIKKLSDISVYDQQAHQQLIMGFQQANDSKKQLILEFTPESMLNLVQETNKDNLMDTLGISEDLAKMISIENKRVASVKQLHNAELARLVAQMMTDADIRLIEAMKINAALHQLYFLNKPFDINNPAHQQAYLEFINTSLTNALSEHSSELVAALSEELKNNSAVRDQILAQAEMNESLSEAYIIFHGHQTEPYELSRNKSYRTLEALLHAEKKEKVLVEDVVPLMQSIRSASPTLIFQGILSKIKTSSVLLLSNLDHQMEKISAVPAIPQSTTIKNEGVEEPAESMSDERNEFREDYKYSYDKETGLHYFYDQLNEKTHYYNFNQENNKYEYQYSYDFNADDGLGSYVKYNKEIKGYEHCPIEQIFDVDVEEIPVENEATESMEVENETTESMEAENKALESMSVEISPLKSMESKPRASRGLSIEELPETVAAKDNMDVQPLRGTLSRQNSLSKIRIIPDDAPVTVTIVRKKEANDGVEAEPEKEIYESNPIARIQSGGTSILSGLKEDELNQGDKRIFDYNPNSKSIGQYTETLGSNDGRRHNHRLPAQITVDKFPTEGSEQDKVQFAMYAATQLLTHRDRSPSKEDPLLLQGRDIEAVGYLWTALMLIGEKTPGMRFGHEAIMIRSSSGFNPKKELNSGLGLFKKYNDKSLYHRVFKKNEDYCINSLQMIKAYVSEEKSKGLALSKHQMGLFGIAKDKPNNIEKVEQIARNWLF